MKRPDPAVTKHLMQRDELRLLGSLPFRHDYNACRRRDHAVRARNRRQSFPAIDPLHAGRRAAATAPPAKAG